MRILQIAQVAAQNETNIDINEALDEITEEIVNMQNKDMQNGNGTSGGQRTVVGDIEKLKKIAQILETVGQAVLPAVVDSQINAQNSETNSAKIGVSSEPGKILPNGLKLLQHHSSLASSLNEPSPVQSHSKVDNQIE